jgi:NTP pyrophosphatase (non-canonical NTP hydrolase)
MECLEGKRELEDVSGIDQEIGDVTAVVVSFLLRMLTVLLWKSFFRDSLIGGLENMRVK